VQTVVCHKAIPVIASTADLFCRNLMGNTQHMLLSQRYLLFWGPPASSVVTACCVHCVLRNTGQTWLYRLMCSHGQGLFKIASPLALQLAVYKPIVVVDCIAPT
jgi:hypothetical protein